MIIGIHGVGACIGEVDQSNEALENVVTNFDREIAGRSLDEWVKDRYGIKNRVKTKRLPSDLAADACIKAVSKSGLTMDRIDFLILNTATGDYKQPTTATETQGKIGMREGTFAFELNMPCAGNIYGIALARAMIMSGMGQFGLVVGVDKMTDLIDQKEFIMASMFGDAAGACVVGPNGHLLIEDHQLSSTRDEELSLCIAGGASVYPLTAELLSEGKQYLQMKGSSTSEFIIRSISDVASTLLNRNELEAHQLRRVIPHQASQPIVLKALRRSHIEESQVEFSNGNYGNTSAASILVTLDQFINKSSDHQGFILIVGMGGGLNWGGILLRSI